MTQWSEMIERHLADTLAQCCAKAGHFGEENTEQLWVWQGHRRVHIKEALGLALPPVYRPPKADLAGNQPTSSFEGQRWLVETEPNLLVDVHVHTGAAKPRGYVLRVFEAADPEPQREFCRRVSELGLLGLSTALRGSDVPNGLHRLSEIYLGLGRCYAGAAAGDLLRVLDFVDQQFMAEGTPILLVLSGVGIPLGLAFAAIDQRVSGLIVDFTDAPAWILAPTGQPPLFLSPYLRLGPNPLLVLAQCCAPRPMTLVHPPTQTPAPWLQNRNSGVLPLVDQLVELQCTYQAAGGADRLNIVMPDQPPPSVLDLIAKYLPM